MTVTEATKEFNEGTPLWVLYPSRFVRWIRGRDYSTATEAPEIVIDKKIGDIVYPSYMTLHYFTKRQE